MTVLNILDTSFKHFLKFCNKKFKTLKIEDPPELLGIKIFLAFPKEGEDAPLWDLAKELELDIKDIINKYHVLLCVSTKHYYDEIEQFLIEKNLNLKLSR